MAARNANVTCPEDTWTELTNGAATGDLTVALVRGQVILAANATGSDPSTDVGPALYWPGDGWSEATIAEKFPGQGTPDRLFALAGAGGAVVFVSHA